MRQWPASQQYMQSTQLQSRRHVNVTHRNSQPTVATDAVVAGQTKHVVEANTACVCCVAMYNCSGHAQQLNGNVCMAWQDKGVAVRDPCKPYMLAAMLGRGLDPILA